MVNESFDPPKATSLFPLKSDEISTIRISLEISLLHSFCEKGRCFLFEVCWGFFVPLSLWRTLMLGCASQLFFPSLLSILKIETSRGVRATRFPFFLGHPSPSNKRRRFLDSCTAFAERTILWCRYQFFSPLLIKTIRGFLLAIENNPPVSPS